VNIKLVAHWDCIMNECRHNPDNGGLLFIE